MDGKARSSGKGASRRVLFAALACTAVLGGMIAAAVPAGATGFALSGKVVCSNGDHVITWTITNQTSNTVKITAFTAKDPDSYDVTGYTSPLAAGATTHGTTVIPGNLTGGVVLYVNETWDGGQSSDQSSLDLGDPCPAATSTTTTSTTFATTTTAAPTTTTVAAAGSTVATTAPAASTTVAPAALPKTGSGSGGAIIGVVTLALGGIALLVGGRRRRTA